MPRHFFSNLFSLLCCITLRRFYFYKNFIYMLKCPVNYIIVIPSLDNFVESSVKIYRRRTTMPKNLCLALNKIPSDFYDIIHLTWHYGNIFGYLAFVVSFIFGVSLFIILLYRDFSTSSNNRPFLCNFHIYYWTPSGFFSISSYSPRKSGVIHVNLPIGRFSKITKVRQYLNVNYLAFARYLTKYF